MSYIRVLPRDAFNESMLLKCIGKLVILIEDGKLPNWTYRHDEDTFDIQQEEGDGSISVANIHFTRNGKPVRVSTPLNCRVNWCLQDDEGNWLFTSNGELLPEGATEYDLTTNYGGF